MENGLFSTHAENKKDTILIVDDIPANIEIVSAILSSRGYQTISANGGAECIEKAKKEKPNLILLDINMPIMNGLEVCKILRGEELTNEIPVIFLTGNTDNNVLKEAFDSGGSDYVCKPINSIELLSRIKSALSQQKLKQKLVEKEKLSAVLEMAGAICHELNQPMQVISIHSELIKMDIPEGHSISKDIDVVSQQIEKMKDIIKKLMHITKYETRDYIQGQKIIDIDKATANEL